MERSPATQTDHSISRLFEVSHGNRDAEAALMSQVYAQVNKSIEVLALHGALKKQARLDPRQARVVEMHFFGCLTFVEIANVLDASEQTIKRDWTMARACFKLELSKQS